MAEKDPVSGRTHDKYQGPARLLPVAASHADSRGARLRPELARKDFDLLLNEAAQRAPIGELVDIMDVGLACA